MGCKDLYGRNYSQSRRCGEKLGRRKMEGGVFEGKSEGGVGLEYHVVGKGKGLGRG